MGLNTVKLVIKINQGGENVQITIPKHIRCKNGIKCKGVTNDNVFNAELNKITEL